jgi:hypothetical protein
MWRTEKCDFRVVSERKGKALRFYIMYALATRHAMLSFQIFHIGVCVLVKQKFFKGFPPNISVSRCFHEHMHSAGFCSSTSITTSQV